MKYIDLSACLFIIGLFMMVFLFGGEIDIADALIYHLTDGVFDVRK